MLFIFDKDGTLCRSRSGQKFINSPADQELIPGVAEKLQALRDAGHKIGIASNQGGVAWGIMTFEVASNIMHHAGRLTGADAYAFCPYHPKGTVAEWAKESGERKPGPGMLLRLMDRLGYSPAETVFVGDREEDKGAAEAAGVRFEWASDFFGF